MTRSPERVRVLLATARNNPEFARRLAEAMPASRRAELASALAQPASDKPGLAKCSRSGARSACERQSPMSAQLNLFARSVSRIG